MRFAGTWTMLAAGVAGLGSMAAAQTAIRPGAVWRDTGGQTIQAHGGGVLQVGRQWFWYGEDRGQGPGPDATRDTGKRFVHCYRSGDLMQWTDCGVVLSLAEPEDMRARHGGEWILERPKVFRVQGGTYVLYFHADAGYKAAEVGVAVSDRPEGPFRFVKHFRPLGQESRDIGQFVDDDGTNYLLFESRPTGGFFIARLTPDGMNVTETAFVKAPLEGGAMVHVGDRYYCVGSHMTGWAPNPNVYATARTVSGPWSAWKDLAPASKDTWGSQSSMLLKVQGTSTTTVIYMGDAWRPKALWDSRYVWMPVTMSEGTMELPEPQPWRLDVGTGQVQLVR